MNNYFNTQVNTYYVITTYKNYSIMIELCRS